MHLIFYLNFNKYTCKWVRYHYSGKGRNNQQQGQVFHDSGNHIWSLLDMRKIITTVKINVWYIT